MKHVSIKEAKDRLPALVRAAEEGERVVITRNGKPVAEVIRHEKAGGLDLEGLRAWKRKRGYALVAGPIPEDFDDPLPEDVLITPSL
jgi:prevent-host-death family protein